MTATTKQAIQESLAPVAPDVQGECDPAVKLEDCAPCAEPDAPAGPNPEITPTVLYSALVDIFENVKATYLLAVENRAAVDSLAIDVQALREEVKAGAGLTQCSCVDQDTLAGIYRAIQAREAAHPAPEASQDAPDEPDAAGERERAIPAHVAADLSSCHATGYADAGITAFTSHAAFMARAAREGAPESQVGFLIRLIARLNLSQQPATVRAALGSAVASGRAPSPNMTAVLHRARPAGSTPATHLGTLAWLAATPPGEQFSRYSLIMQRARTAEALYAEWDANVEIGR